MDAVGDGCGGGGRGGAGLKRFQSQDSRSWVSAGASRGAAVEPRAWEAAAGARALPF